MIITQRKVKRKKTDRSERRKMGGNRAKRLKQSSPVSHCWLHTAETLICSFNHTGFQPGHSKAWGMTVLFM